MFVHSNNAGKRFISDNVITNAGIMTHHDICVLERKKSITFEEAEHFRQAFGVRAWACKLTEKGRSELAAALVFEQPQEKA